MQGRAFDAYQAAAAANAHKTGVIGALKFIAILYGGMAFADLGGGEEAVVEEGGSVTSVFWSGGDAAKSAATDWAIANGGETIGMTARGRALEVLTRGMDWSKARPLWDAGSKDFAEGAVGDVHVFQNASGVGVTSIRATTKYQALLDNPNVTNIIYRIVGGGFLCPSGSQLLGRIFM
jgi:hypothetical protein